MRSIPKYCEPAEAGTSTNLTFLAFLMLLCKAEVYLQWNESRNHPMHRNISDIISFKMRPKVSFCVDVLSEIFYRI